MKKLINLSFFIALSLSAFGQKFWTVPAVVDADLDAPFTVYIDLSQTDNATMSGLLDADPTMEVYLWCWGIDGASTNGDWTGSAPNRLMTKDAAAGPKVYKYTFGPSFRAFWGGKSDDKIFGAQMGCLAKAKDGSGSPEKKTEDLKYSIPAPIIGKQLLGSFPTASGEAGKDTVFVRKNDIVTFIYNNSLDTLKDNTAGGSGIAANVVGGTRYNMGPNDMCTTAVAYFDDGTKVGFGPLNGSGADTNAGLEMAFNGNGEYILQFVPEQFFLDPRNPNAAQVQAKLDAGKKILRVEFQPFRKRAIPGAGAYLKPFLPIYTVRYPKGN